MLDSHQLAERKLGIGGSDAACLVGCDFWRQPMDLYLDKTGQLEDGPDLELTSQPVRWGNRLEGLIAQEWGVDNNLVPVVRKDPFIHPDYPFVRCNVDRLIAGKEEGLEVKARGTFNAEEYGPSGTDQVKDSDIIQCQHQMLCTGYKLWHMAVLIGGQDLRSYRIPWDDGLIDDLLGIEDQFWNHHVVKRIPPDLDFSHHSSPDLIKRFYPGTNGATVILPERAIELHKEIRRLAEIGRDAGKEGDALKIERAVLLGENAVGVLPDGSGGWSRKRITWKGYTLDDTSYIGTYFSKKHRRI